MIPAPNLVILRLRLLLDKGFCAEIFQQNEFAIANQCQTCGYTLGWRKLRKSEVKYLKKSDLDYLIDDFESFIGGPDRDRTDDLFHDVGRRLSC